MFEETKEMMELFEENGRRKVLIAGIDISKNKFTITVLNGMYEELIKSHDVSLNKKCVKELYKKIDSIISKEGIKEMIFGCEPSGIYYKPIIRELMTKYPHGRYKLINPSATKSNRDQRMEREKNDSIDAYAIADLLIRGQCYNLIEDDNVFKIIKEYVKELDHIVKEMVRFKNKIHASTDEIYPGLESKSNSLLDSKYGKRFLKVMPAPENLPNFDIKDWQKILSTDEYQLPMNISKKLKEKCSQISVSRLSNFETIRDYITFMVEGYEQLEKRRTLLEEKLGKLIEGLDFGPKLMEIGGLSTLSIARIVAYTSNPYRFKTGKEVASFAGLLPKADQSGKKDKGKILSKKGHKKLRSELVQAAQRVITSTGYFTAYYNRLVLENHKEPMVAIIATANKLIKVIMHMIHTGEEFNPPTAKDKEKAKGKIPRLTSSELRNLNKIKRWDSLTQDIKELYLARV